MQIDYRDLVWGALENRILLKMDYSKVFFMIPSYTTSLIGWDFEKRPCLQIMVHPDTEKVDIPWIIISYVFTLKREWQFYITRVVLLLCIISLLTNFVFIFGEDVIADKFGFISTMLLAGVAYVFVVSGYIPPLKYFTWLDYYLYFTFLYIGFIGIEVGITTIILIDDLDFDDFNIDYLFLVCNFIIWIIVHIIFYLRAKQDNDIEINKISQPKCTIDKKVKYYGINAKSDENNNVIEYKHNFSKDKRVPITAFVRTNF